MENATEQVEKVPTITDAQKNAKWDSMLKVFKGIIENDPEPETVKEKLQALSQSAINTQMLTSRQKEGIVDRCRYYMDGTYGKGLAHTK